jgi:hypothetical protein
VSRGGRWPDGSRCAPGSVLIWSGEDDPADTLLPRLLAMGADVSKVHFVNGTRDGGEILPFDPARDLVQLTQAAQKIGDVRLVMVDPVVSAVGGDSHKNTEVRRALQPLVDLGSVLQAAVVGITHFTKGTAGRDPTERVVGSVAFGAVARVVMAAAKVQNDDGEAQRILVRSKSNIGPDDGGFQYEIEQLELDTYPGVFASRVTWGAAVEGTARELLAEAEQETDADDASALDDAVEFLKAELADAPMLAVEVYKIATANGHARRTIERAKRQVNVLSRKGPTGWYWSIPNPAKTAKVAKIANISNGDVGGDVGGDVALQAKSAIKVATQKHGDVGDVGDLGDVAKVKPAKPAKAAKGAMKNGGDVALEFIGPPDLRRQARELVLRHVAANDLPEREREAWLQDAHDEPRAVIASMT